ncbi:hypothetical protein EPUS_02485 [Endocarpon pusillum Z07020]|uniref:ER-bound oxygenase mpaB/mpaB'/Rubber oxygenase catalytic domain-containing protein n=1 Tax=Endocarpon pusillum (strain Z07020 / HMAS-L-300199) TaxID=1263415 RepID=U1HNN0_ENDPU|nr:uncharacterized protein EPUS_02485 [Endocarpon pusillum Z07020]ERF70619.1 hypothetical protein EPUS_02485 [Endocarpon pusillum Z07020]
MDNMTTTFGTSSPAYVTESSPMPRSLPWVVALLLGYPLLQQYLRYRRLNAMKTKYNYSTRQDLAKMTDQEAWEIFNNLAELEFPTMFEKGIQFALFRTYGIPTISSLLVKTTQLSTTKNAGKRYADTVVLLAEIFGNKPTSERAIDSFGRMNYLHGVYRDAGQILDDDMLYTLALFAIEPIKWVERYDWRKFSDLEKCAMGTFMKSMGDAMLIDYGNLPSAERGFRDGIHWLEEIWQWAEEYEIKHMVPNEKNHQTANETTALLLITIPDALKPMGKHAVSAMMDDRYPRPPPIYFRVLDVVLALRKYFMKYIALPRPSFMRYRLLDDKEDSKGRRAVQRYDAYPFYVRPTFWNRWGPSAWPSRLLGLPLPGDSGDIYYPKGYSLPEVGPNTFVGKGSVAASETKARLMKERTGGCPFAVLR